MRDRAAAGTDEHLLGGEFVEVATDRRDGDGELGGSVLDFQPASLGDGIQQKAWFCGPPAHVIEGIKSIEAKYPGLEDFMIHWAEGLPAREFMEQLRWFARDVMPAFQG